MTLTAPPWQRAEIDMLNSKAEQIELAADTLMQTLDLYSGGRRHEVRSFIDQLRIDAQNYRERVKHVGGSASRPAP